MSTLAMGKGLIDPRYCCCAIPLVNAGIYTVIGEQAVLGAAIGIVVFATPDIVGASFPSFGGDIFAVICFIVAAFQPIGFIGVLREKTSTFKVYTLLNALGILAALICSAALIITSALRHDTAVTDCEYKFFSDVGNSSSTANETLASEGQALCSAFAWADVGIMGGLWVILLIVQGYFVYLTRVYSASQVSDHKLYHSVYSENPEAFTMSILRSTRYNPGSVYNAMPGPDADAWDARPSMDSVRDVPALHGGYSDGSQPLHYEDNYGKPQNYPPNYEMYSPAEQQGGQYAFATPGGGYVDHPAETRTRQEEGTPMANQYSGDQGLGYSGVGTGLRRPEEMQNHPDVHY
ncbi:hypothetical protein J008_05396 [Cryptococcus neoformans]|nr:hypothetical protein J008_05396 [Cryptococcus neoformans var. grubii]